MTISLLFWIIYLVALVFGFWPSQPFDRIRFGGSIVLFVLIGLLGWRVFGAAVKG